MSNHHSFITSQDIWLTFSDNKKLFLLKENGIIYIQVMTTLSRGTPVSVEYSLDQFDQSYYRCKWEIHDFNITNYHYGMSELKIFIHSEDDRWIAEGKVREISFPDFRPIISFLPNNVFSSYGYTGPVRITVEFNERERGASYEIFGIKTGTIKEMDPDFYKRYRFLM